MIIIIIIINHYHYHHYLCCLQYMTLSEVLQCDGHTTKLECIDDRNEVEVWVNGELVFRCDIRELEYGIDMCIALYCLY